MQSWKYLHAWVRANKNTFLQCKEFRDVFKHTILFFRLLYTLLCSSLVAHFALKWKEYFLPHITSLDLSHSLHFIIHSAAIEICLPLYNNIYTVLMCFCAVIAPTHTSKLIYAAELRRRFGDDFDRARGFVRTPCFIIKSVSGAHTCAQPNGMRSIICLSTKKPLGV